MATLNLGRIKPVFRGAYAGGTAYVVDDIVTDSGETFICILASTGNATSNATYWTKLAQKGTDGIVKSGGLRELIPYMGKLAIAMEVNGIFMETHKDPDSAPSDGPNMIPLDELSNLLKLLKNFDVLSKSNI